MVIIKPVLPLIALFSVANGDAASAGDHERVSEELQWTPNLFLELRIL